jgi:hypothetical protein
VPYSIYAKNGIQHATFGGSTWSVSSLYVALFTSVPTDSTSGTEVTYANGYARKGVAPGSANWGVSSGGQIANVAVIQFAQATDSWGTVYGYGVFDTGSGGNRISQNSFGGGALTVNSGELVTIGINGVIYTITQSC